MRSSGPSPHPRRRRTGPRPHPLRPGGPQAAADRYVVVLSDAASGASRAARAARTAAAVATAERAGGTVLARYERVLDGYAAHLSPTALAAVRADPAVAYVERDSVIHGGLVDTRSVQATQPNPPSWGLDRIDQRALPLNNNYGYVSTGAGVTVYIVDSGIRASHVDFGTRASGVYDAVGDGNGTNDCHGHGTHVAGTAGGTTYGVAKRVTIKAVRVLQCDNSGFTSDLIEGMDWIAGHRDPVSVANFSLQGYGTAPNQAAENLLNLGVKTVFIANNFNTDACTNGPRSARGVTVAAVTDTDTRASFSSYGSCVDVFAPGVSITSAGIASDTASAPGWSGTSMAAPHVTGWLARYLQGSPGATMAQAKTALITASTKNVVINPGPSSPNRLLYANPT
ncbi:S8 family serine peptidase [Actinomycetes bacterium KLBMP 9797]